MQRIVLVAVGEIELDWLESIHDALPDILGRRCRIEPHAFDLLQHSAHILLGVLPALGHGEEAAVTALPHAERNVDIKPSRTRHAGYVLPPHGIRSSFP